MLKGDRSRILCYKAWQLKKEVVLNDVGERKSGRGPRNVVRCLLLGCLVHPGDVPLVVDRLQWNS
jgi:hypothetical protein